MNTTMSGAHPPPLCQACAFNFHDQCTGCNCRCDQATAGRLTAAAIADHVAPAAVPPVAFTRDEVAELANLGAVYSAGCRDQRHGLCPVYRTGEPAAGGGCACPCHLLGNRRGPEPAAAGSGYDPDGILDPPRPPAPGWSPARLAYAFYATAAAGAAVGQVWVALTRIDWSPAIPMAGRVAMVLPFALVLELLAMVLAAMGDQRQQLGERAYGFRVFSAVVAVVAVGVLVAGHWPHLYLVAAFGALSSSAYVLWLLHSAARRRDALRAAGKLATTAPAYGLNRWCPWFGTPGWRVTRRAAELAREQGLGLYPSLRAAELAIRAEQRRPAIAAAVGELVRAEHRDPRMAQIAVTTLDLDRIAAGLTDRADYDQWADRLAPAVMAHPASTRPGAGDDNPQPDVSTNGGTADDKRPRPVTTRQGGSTAERVAKVLAKKPDATPVEVAAKLGISERTAQRNWPTWPPGWPGSQTETS
jgi:hypothetical protein